LINIFNPDVFENHKIHLYRFGLITTSNNYNHQIFGLNCHNTDITDPLVTQPVWFPERKQIAHEHLDYAFRPLYMLLCI